VWESNAAQSGKELGSTQSRRNSGLGGSPGSKAAIHQEKGGDAQGGRDNASADRDEGIPGKSVNQGRSRKYNWKGQLYLRD